MKLPAHTEDVLPLWQPRKRLFLTRAERRHIHTNRLAWLCSALLVALWVIAAIAP